MHMHVVAIMLLIVNMPLMYGIVAVITGPELMLVWVLELVLLWVLKLFLLKMLFRYIVSLWSVSSCRLSGKWQTTILVKTFGTLCILGEENVIQVDPPPPWTVLGVTSQTPFTYLVHFMDLNFV